MSAVEVFILFGLALASVALTTIMVVRYLWSVLSSEIASMIATAIITAEYTMGQVVTVDLDDTGDSEAE